MPAPGSFGRDAAGLVGMRASLHRAHRYLNMDDLREHKKEALRMAA
jgi:hypothetical protein